MFPEDAGLVAVLIGTRGAAARAQTSARRRDPRRCSAPTRAQVGYYAHEVPRPAGRAARCPGADRHALPQLLRDVPRPRARARRVHRGRDERRARAPRRGRPRTRPWSRCCAIPTSPAATTPTRRRRRIPANTTYVFAPTARCWCPTATGRHARKPVPDRRRDPRLHDKAYLTPIEQPPPGDVLGLALAFGAVARPGGARHAGRPARDRDLEGRLDGRRQRPLRGQGRERDPPARGVQRRGASAPTPVGARRLQGGRLREPAEVPEPGWQRRREPDRQLLRHVTFDGQSAIIGRASARRDPGPLRPDNAWIGQNPDTGFLAIAPWIVPDPGIADPSLTLAAAPHGARRRPASKLPDRARPARTRSPSARARTATARASCGPTSTSRTAPATAPSDPRAGAAAPASRAASRVSGTEKQAPVTQHAPRVAAHGTHVYVGLARGTATASRTSTWR